MDVTFSVPSDMHIEVRCKLVSPDLLPAEAPLPRYASEGAAGMDLYAAIPGPVELKPGERRRIPTGIALGLPHAGVVALVYARSGLAWRHGIGLPNGVGVIDSDYTGEIEVLLTNFGDKPHVIQPGDRIAQVVFAPVYRARLVLVEDLPATARGNRGFGSTGR
jgi:dUTP pyrophosphatase